MVVLPIWSYPLLLQVHEKYAGHEEEWRYELRVRYIPTDLKDLYEKDKVTFYYYYDQVSPPWIFWITVESRDIHFTLCELDWLEFFWKSSRSLGNIWEQMASNAVRVRTENSSAVCSPHQYCYCCYELHQHNCLTSQDSRSLHT